VTKKAWKTEKRRKQKRKVEGNLFLIENDVSIVVHQNDSN
jgi:hypothetical protein